MWWLIGVDVVACTVYTFWQHAIQYIFCNHNCVLVLFLYGPTGPIVYLFCLHCTVRCTGQCTVHCTVQFTGHFTVHCTLQCTVHFTLHCTVYCLHYTVHFFVRVAVFLSISDVYLTMYTLVCIISVCLYNFQICIHSRRYKWKKCSSQVLYGPGPE